MAKKLDHVIAALPKHRQEGVHARAMELVAKFPDRPPVVIDHIGADVSLQKSTKRPSASMRSASA